MAVIETDKHIFGFVHGFLFAVGCHIKVAGYDNKQNCNYAAAGNGKTV